jgi:hypothetical protein
VAQLQIPATSPFSYERRRPEDTPLYKIVQENWQNFLRQRENDNSGGLPSFIIKEFDAYLKCGILAHGFLRVLCTSCSHEKLVAFSCKKRGFCPSCGAKRMTETSAWLVDHVLPRRPIRQWVLSFPFQIRYLLACHPKLIASVLKIVNRVIANYQRKRAGLAPTTSQIAAVTLVQRFGSALNTNVHFHSLILDGIYDISHPKHPKFKYIPAPESKDIQAIVMTIAHRVTKHLVKKGYLTQDDDSDAEKNAFERCQKAGCVYRIAFGPRQGQKVLTLGSVQQENLGKTTQHSLCCQYAGFSLHAGVSCQASQRKKLENLVGYICRPAIATDRLYINGQGNVVVKLKKPFANGTTHFIYSPLEFIEKLVSLIPRPRIHLIRFFGILAPHAKCRSLVVPNSATGRTPTEESSQKNQNPKAKMTWAKRLKRVFDIDILQCSHCQGKLKVVSAIEDRRVIAKILNHRNLPTTPPIIHSPRDPPGDNNLAGQSQNNVELEYEDESQAPKNW